MSDEMTWLERQENGAKIWRAFYLDCRLTVRTRTFLRDGVEVTRYAYTVERPSSPRHPYAGDECASEHADLWMAQEQAGVHARQCPWHAPVGYQGR